MRAEIIPSGDNKLDKIVFEILGKYNLPEIISKKTGLAWHKDKIYIKNNEGNADWEGDDTVLVDYRRGIWIVSSIAHELVHLILRQNNWHESKIISDFVKRHPEIVIQGASQKLGEGYSIEQIIAYLIQTEIHKDIGEKEGIAAMVTSWDEEKFEKIIANEFQSEFKERLARLIIKKWQIRKDGANLIKWIEGVLKSDDE